MGARFAANVVLRHPETGDLAIFTAGAECPEWAAEFITNPAVFEAPSAPALPDPTTTPPAVKVPPRGGAGSGHAAWLAYAASMGVVVADGMERSEIIAACEAANVPTE